MAHANTVQTSQNHWAFHLRNNSKLQLKAYNPAPGNTVTFVYANLTAYIQAAYAQA